MKPIKLQITQTDYDVIRNVIDLTEGKIKGLSNSHTGSIHWFYVVSGLKSRFYVESSQFWKYAVRSITIELQGYQAESLIYALNYFDQSQYHKMLFLKLTDEVLNYKHEPIGELKDIISWYNANKTMKMLFDNSPFDKLSAEETDYLRELFFWQQNQQSINT